MREIFINNIYCDIIVNGKDSKTKEFEHFSNLFDYLYNNGFDYGIFDIKSRGNFLTDNKIEWMSHIIYTDYKRTKRFGIAITSNFDLATEGLSAELLMNKHLRLYKIDKLII